MGALTVTREEGAMVLACLPALFRQPSMSMQIFQMQESSCKDKTASDAHPDVSVDLFSSPSSLYLSSVAAGVLGSCPR